MMHRFLLMARGDPERLKNVKGCLDKLRPASIIEGPIVAQRTNGAIGFYAADESHATLSVVRGEATLSIVSARDVDQNKAITAFSEYAGVPISQLRIMDVSNERPIECQEPRCTRPAAKDYNGLKVCADHHEQWQEHEREQQQYKDYT